ncbi:MAG: hypothetical protein QM694_02810 [Aestuariivirga sp.]
MARWKGQYLFCRPEASAARAAYSEVITENREFLHHQPQVLVFIDQAQHFRQALFAPAAIIVEEFHHGHVALGIARHKVVLRVENLLGVGAHNAVALLVVGILLALVQFLAHLDQHFRILEQIFAHDLADLFLLIGRKAVGMGSHGQQQGGGEQGGA